MQKKRQSVQALTEWAFRQEFAQLELPQDFEVQLGRGYGTNSLARFERLERMGCFVDGGGRSDPHEDAEAVAAIVSNMPSDLGGIRASLFVLEHAKAATAPDWMPGAVPTLVPVGWHAANHTGRRAKTEKVGVYIEERRQRHPRNKARWIKRKVTHDVLVCPCTWEPSARQIASMRDAYEWWVDCLEDIRDRLRCVHLRSREVTDALPPRAPWETRGGGSPHALAARL